MKLRTLVPIAAVVVFGAMQLVRPEKTNPPEVTQLKWDSPQTRALAERACMDCHSHQTKWPWYSYVAPLSWLVVHDVDDGRHELNFSNLRMSASGVDKLMREIDRQVGEGEMPLPIYLPTHPEARLSAAEKKQLIDGFRATLKNTYP